MGVQNIDIKLDVVLSTFNSERTIKECLDAIAEEISTNNVIIVDGGSTDQTVDIIKSHKIFKEIKFYSRPDLNLGQSRAFSFQKVTTPYFVQIDSDIVIRKGWFKKMMEDMKSGVGVIEGGRNNHFCIPSKYGDEIDRGLFGQNIIRTDAVKNIKIDDLNVLCNEDNLTRFYVRKRGYSWIKNGCLLADHYSDPERYKNAPIWIYRFNASKKLLQSSGTADRLSRRYNKILFMFLDMWHKPLKLWFELARKCLW